MSDHAIIAAGGFPAEYQAIFTDPSCQSFAVELLCAMPDLESITQAEFNRRIQANPRWIAMTRQLVKKHKKENL